MLGTSIIIHKKKSGPPVKLSLVALMDIFTILVFFLLMNSGDSQTLEDAKFVKLPDSSSQTSPHSELVIHVGQEELWADDKKVIDVKDIPLGKDEPIEALGDVLSKYSTMRGELNDFEQDNGFAVTIMADKAVPYAVLKSVMATCSEQNFRNISLAVNRVSATVFASQAEPATDAAEPSNPQASVEGGR